MCVFFWETIDNFEKDFHLTWKVTSGNSVDNKNFDMEQFGAEKNEPME